MFGSYAVMKGERRMYEIRTDYHQFIRNGYVQIFHGSGDLSPVFRLQDYMDIQMPQNTPKRQTHGVSCLCKGGCEYEK